MAVEDIMEHNFGDWGNVEQMILKVIDSDGGISLEISGKYKGRKIVCTLHPWTLAMVNECYNKFNQMTYLRALCGRSLEAKITQGLV